MSPKHTVKAISNFAVTIACMAAAWIYAYGVIWVFENAPSVLVWYLISSIPATFIVLAAMKVGGDAD